LQLDELMVVLLRHWSACRVRSLACPRNSLSANFSLPSILVVLLFPNRQLKARVNAHKTISSQPLAAVMITRKRAADVQSFQLVRL
jgi:hypothetical protein